MRKVLAIWLVAALVMTLAVPALAGPPPGKGPSSKGPKVKSKVSVEGVITVVGSNVSPSSFTMQIRTPGHQRQVGAASATFLVNSSTELKVTVKGSGNTFSRPASVNDLRVGDRAHVEALRLNTGEFLATRIHVKNRTIEGQPPQPPPGAQVSGVVIAKGTNSLTVLTSDGSVWTILVTDTTIVRGLRSSFAEIQVTDTVVVFGTVTAVRRITASQIEVTGPGATDRDRGLVPGAQVTGVITAKSTTPQLLILDNSLAVSVSEDTLIVSGGLRRSYADLAVGQTVAVTGTPIIIGGIRVGINARVISF